VFSIEEVRDGRPIRPDDDQINEKGTATMKLTTATMVSVDGVMQGLGAPEEDRSGGFERGGWLAPLWDNEAGTFLNQVYERADAFLFDRRTYEIFAGSWGLSLSEALLDPFRVGRRPVSAVAVLSVQAPLDVKGEEDPLLLHRVVVGCCYLCAHGRIVHLGCSSHDAELVIYLLRRVAM
jgi:hypothetical protein